MKENAIQRAIRLDLGKLPNLVLWRNETGAYASGCTISDLKTLLGMLTNGEIGAATLCLASWTRRAQWVSYGLCKGSADLIGIIKPSGRFFALELKTDTGRLTEEQQLYLSLVNSMGGYAAVARSVDEARKHFWNAAEGKDA
jgi:hypothetical protein